MTTLEQRIERRRRCQISLWAYAYEVMNDPIVSDEKFDSTCLQINPDIKTGRLDDFFATEFSPCTGMWIYRHPELNRVAALYERLTSKKAIYTDVRTETDLPVAKSARLFNTHIEMQIYLASLGFNVPESSLISSDFGRLDFAFDKNWFSITQCSTGMEKICMYSDWFGRA